MPKGFQKGHKSFVKKTRDYKGLSKTTFYYNNNPEKFREQARKRYWNNRDKMIEASKRYRANNREKYLGKKRKETYKSRYGITIETYEVLFQTQNGLCAICSGVAIGRSKFLSVDHNHETGKIRGLLCTRCNTAIGLTKENIEILKKIIDYLNKHNENM